MDSCELAEEPFWTGRAKILEERILRVIFHHLFTTLVHESEGVDKRSGGLLREKEVKALHNVMQILVLFPPTIYHNVHHCAMGLRTLLNEKMDETFAQIAAVHRAKAGLIFRDSSTEDLVHLREINTKMLELYSQVSIRSTPAEMAIFDRIILERMRADLGQRIQTPLDYMIAAHTVLITTPISHIHSHEEEGEQPAELFNLLQKNERMFARAIPVRERIKAFLEETLRLMGIEAPLVL